MYNYAHGDTGQIKALAGQLALFDSCKREFMGGMNADGCAEVQTLKVELYAQGFSTVTCAVLRHFSAHTAQIKNNDRGIRNMNLKQTFEAITKKTEEAGKQQTDISRKLEANKAEKAKAEAAKAAALEAKDEQAYKNACRAIADADAGIEFNTICLRETKQKQLATDAENRGIKQGLRDGLKEIYATAIDEIEKAMKAIITVSEEALNKLNAIDGMAQAWDAQVMKQTNTTGSTFTADRKLVLNQYIGTVRARLDGIKTMRESDPFLKEGGK